MTMWRVRMGWTETYSGGRRQDAEAFIDGFQSEREAADFATAVFDRFLTHTFNALPWFQTYQEEAA